MNRDLDILKREQLREPINELGLGLADAHKQIYQTDLYSTATYA
jgi:hypothetical protein